MTDLFESLDDPRARLVLGTLNFGTAQDRDMSFALLDTFVDLGGRVVDSAHVYGNWDPSVPSGASERMIGSWLRSRGAVDSVSVTTKIGHPSLDTPGVARLDAMSLRTDVREAQEHLGLETIPLVYLHRDDEDTPVAEIMAPLEDLVAEGVIGAYGASNWTVPRLRESRDTASAEGWSGFAANQPAWGLARTRPGAMARGMVAMDEEMYAFHSETRMTVSPYSSQSKGYFARWTRRAADETIQIFDDARNRTIAQRLDEMASTLGVPATELSVAVLLRSPFPTFPVIGVRNADQLRSSFRAVSVELSADTVAAVIGDDHAY